MALEHELATYEHELPTLLSSEGKHVVIHGGKVIGIYDTYNHALQVGYDQCGLQPFLVKRIEAMEHAHGFTREITPCRI